MATPDAQTLQHQLQLANGFGAPAGGGWTIVPSLNVDEMFTDNVLEVNSPRRWDLVTLVTPGISIAGDLPRLQVKLDYNPTLSLAARTDSQDAISQSLNGTALLTLVPDLAFVDVRALASVQSTSGLVAGASAGNTGTSVSPTNSTVGLANQDRIQTTNIGVSPYLLHKFGDFGTGKLGVSASETQYATSTGFAVSPFPTGGGQGGKQLTTEEIAQFTTGEFLERFSDTISIDLTQSTSSANSVINAAGNVTAVPTTTFNSRRDTAQDQLNYAANRWVTVFGTLGYESISYSQTLAQKIDDMTWSVGATLTPNPDSDLTISYGHQNGSNSIQASAHYELTARTTISGSY
ncbi:outer membrane beta-barrel protein, partial [Acidisphaera sp. S103]|uniref:outer membrane beta-barrel protein n=1 Tax=Acidisphaera sp. S103 TaxID=1747223 RepID=UPI001C2097DF